jgi:hypothetical protein
LVLPISVWLSDGILAFQELDAETFTDVPSNMAVHEPIETISMSRFER